VLAPGQWFVYDEFDYFHAGDEPLLLWLLRPHNEHTIAVTKVWFGALLPIVGLRAYDLYLAPLVVAHIIVIGAIHRLVWHASASQVYAVGSAVMAAAMGAAAGTLTWAGQLQYVGAAAAGMLAIVLAVESPTRARRLALFLITLLGTLSGTAFVPLALASAAAFAVRRRWADGAIVSAIPIGWQLLVRIIWTPELSYAPGGIDEIVGAGPEFAVSVLHAAISQTARTPYLTGPLLVALLAGTLAELSSIGPRRAKGARLAVGTLALATLLSLAALIAGRLGRGADEAASGHYSYLFLITLLPLGGILLAPFARRRSAVVAAATAMVTLAVLGQLKLADDATALSAWKQHGRAVMQANAAMLAEGAQAYPDPVPAPATAPTVSLETLRSWVAAGWIDRTTGDQTLADQASLNTQWRLIPSMPVAGECRVASMGEEVPVPPDPTLSVAGQAVGTIVTIRYPEGPAARGFELERADWRLESIASRAATLSVDSGEVRICVGE
jgi:hypothetical protein